MIRRFPRWLSRHLGTPRVIYDRAGVSPYLSRWYIVGRPRMMDGSDPIDSTGCPRPDAIFPVGIGVYLHRFHRSDDDSALHNHPWKWARALILAGGYSEERRFAPLPGHPYKVARRTLLPGSWVHINADDFHRVDLLEADSWSLFIAGPKAASWGFWEPRTGEFLPWRDFIAKIRGPKWEGRK